MRNGRAIALIVMVASSTALWAFALGQSGEAQEGGVGIQYKGKLDPIGPFHWPDLDGRPWTDRDFRGKVLIVQQWASWCMPCVAEFPQMQRLYDMVRKDPSIGFVSVNMDRDVPAIRDFLDGFRKTYSFPVLFAGAHLKITSLPRTWVVDREGYIREVFGGGPDLIEQALALAESVKRRPPVASLPPETRKAVREQNEKDSAKSR